jgi:hypothetical protein
MRGVGLMDIKDIRRQSVEFGEFAIRGIKYLADSGVRFWLINLTYRDTVEFKTVWLSDEDQQTHAVSIRDWDNFQKNRLIIKLEEIDLPPRERKALMAAYNTWRFHPAGSLRILN